jgi:putative Holliday junction resolvase
MRYLAIDYGLKRLGLALCDPSETIVSPLCQLTLDRGRMDKTFEQIIGIIHENQVDALVVGLPLNMDDSEGPQAKVTRQFAGQMAGKISIPIYMQDERLSSHAADEKLLDSGLTRKKKKNRRDMLAACDILQDFLDHKTIND